MFESEPLEIDYSFLCVKGEGEYAAVALFPTSLVKHWEKEIDNKGDIYCEVIPYTSDIDSIWVSNEGDFMEIKKGENIPAGGMGSMSVNKNCALVFESDFFDHLNGWEEVERWLIEDIGINPIPLVSWESI